MNNTNDGDSKIILQIHEHLGPFRERLSKVEARIDSHSKILDKINDNFKTLDNKVEENHLVNIKSIIELKEFTSSMFKQHRIEDDALFETLNANIESYKDEFKKIKWAVLGGISVISFIFTTALVLLSIFYRGTI